MEKQTQVFENGERVLCSSSVNQTVNIVLRMLASRLMLRRTLYISPN